jgi:hypothetical protein
MKEFPSSIEINDIREIFTRKPIQAYAFGPSFASATVPGTNLRNNAEQRIREALLISLILTISSCNRSRSSSPIHTTGQKFDPYPVD